MPIKDLVSLRPALEELERALTWAAHEVDDIPFKLVPVIQTHGKKARCAGWFSENQWSTREGELVHEITFAAEMLDRDPIDIVATAVHEVVHFWCNHLELKDTSTGGRHNKVFKEYAGILGLDCAQPYDSYGFGYTTPTAELRERIEKEFQPDVAALNLFRIVKPRTTKTVKTNAWICKCAGLTLRIPAQQKLDATCHKCKSKFKPKEPEVKDGPGPVVPKVKKVKAHKHEAGLPEHAEDFPFHEHKEGEGHEVTESVNTDEPLVGEPGVNADNVVITKINGVDVTDENRTDLMSFGHTHTAEYPLHQHDGESHGNYEVEDDGNWNHDSNAGYEKAEHAGEETQGEAQGNQDEDEVQGEER